MDLGPPELIIVLVIALVLFGGAKLPELARGLGSAKKEYERGLHGDDAAPEREQAPDREPVHEHAQPALPAAARSDEGPGASTITAPAPAPEQHPPTNAAEADRSN